MSIPRHVGEGANGDLQFRNKQKKGKAPSSTGRGSKALEIGGSWAVVGSEGVIRFLEWRACLAQFFRVLGLLSRNSKETAGAVGLA
jgi:hypothetical protein